MSRLAWAILLALSLPSVSAQNASAPSSPYDHSPIRYHLDASNLTLATRWYDAKVYQAIAWWTENGAREMGWAPQFARVDDAASADIRMWFRDAPTVGETCGDDPEALGCARTEDGGRSWDIEIKTRRGGDGAHYSHDTVGDVAKHELGHALGLPHSAVRGDIMFPSVDATSYADAQPIDHPGLVLAGLGGVALLIVASVWAIRRVSRDPAEDEDAPADDAPPRR